MRNNRGSSLVEALLAIAIFGLLATAMTGVLIYGRTASVTAGANSRALLLAQEGQAAVRNIRDADFNNLVDGTYGLQVSGGVWNLVPSPDVQSEFTRTVTISTVDTNTKSVQVEVDWQKTLQRLGHIELTSQYTRWQDTIPSNQQVFRIKEYFINSGFTGATYDLTLNYNLVNNYFVIVRGSDGNANSGGNYGPNRNYARLTHDPFGTGDLDPSTGPNKLRLSRGSGGGPNSWTGVVTVVECLLDCDGAGFSLLDVAAVSHSGASTSGTKNISTNWSNVNQVMLMGGFNGSGCSTSESSSSKTNSCYTRLYPSGSNQISWTRDSAGTTLSSSFSTVMAVQWGSEWQVQRRNVAGANGGDGADALNEYSLGVISPVPRANTWVWGTGHTTKRGIGNGAEGTLITLGNGVNKSTTESTIAVGQEYSDQKSFEVYALSHPSLVVDYRFKPDGHSSSLTYDQAVTNGSGAQKFALVYNGQSGTGTAYPRPIFSARYLNNTTIRAERRRSGQNWPAWIEGVDFSAINLQSDSTPPAPITNLSASTPTVNSIKLSWTAPGDDGTAGAATSYDLRYSTSPIIESNWASATPASGEPAPVSAGAAQTMIVSGLDSNTTYFFAIKTLDEVPNISSISNSPSATTLSAQANSLFLSSATTNLCCGNKKVRGIIIGNLGLSPITIDRMIVSWTNGGALNFDGIRLDNNWRWGPSSSAPNGANVDIVNHTLATGNTTNNEIDFSSNMNGAKLTITFIMSDGSMKSLSGINL